MAIAPTAPPQQPQAPQPSVVQNASMATTPQGGITPTGQNFDSLKNDWLGFLRSPEVISGMLQFGASALAGSNVGTSLAEAAQAASGTREAIQQRGQQGLEESNRQRAIAAQERGTAVQEKGQAEDVRANQAREAQAKEAAKIAQDQFTVNMGLEMKKLGLEQQRVDAYTAMAGRTVAKPTTREQAQLQLLKNVTMGISSGLIDPSEQDAILRAGNAAINKTFPAGGATGGKGGGTPSASGAASGTGSLPTVTTQQEYDAVPPGNQYLDPQGNTRTKPTAVALP